jgi:DNA-binding transcriptional regulator YiaG
MGFLQKGIVTQRGTVMNGNQIRELRVTMGLTQEEFAHRLGVTLCTVNRWENNKVAPSRLAIKQLQTVVTSKRNQN